MINTAIGCRDGNGMSLNHLNNIGIHALLSFRPTDATGARVIPRALLNHCQSNDLPKPYCLCPLKCPTTPAFVETTFLLMDGGVHSGEHVAKCANDICGYFGA